MSLTTYVKAPDITSRIREFRPNLPRSLGVPIKVPARSKRYTLIGTAFDYFLRFELKRRAPHSIETEWVAEHCVRTTSTAERGNSMVFGPVSISGDEGSLTLLDSMAEVVPSVIRKARADVADYVSSNFANQAARSSIAAHAIRLAKIDAIYRAGYLDPTLADALPEDVEELLALIEVAPFNELIDDTQMILNPTFGSSSRIVGGADCDLIRGGLMVDFMTTIKSEISLQKLDQIFGYYLLARRERSIDKAFPKIDTVGVYFARHGHLLTIDAKEFTNRPGFEELEAWFFENARQHNEISPKAADLKSKGESHDRI